MQRMITGATGLIGKRLVEHWLNASHHLIVVGRSEERLRNMFGARVQAVSWEHLTPDMLQACDVVVNLAGASVGAKPWSNDYQQEILNSRIDATSKLASMLAALPKPVPTLFNASAIGIYGLQTQQAHRLPPYLDESIKIDFQQPVEFLSQVGCRWEQAAQAAIAAEVRVVFLRFAVVLAKEGGALPQIAAPFKWGVGGPVGSGKQPFCWVAIDDVIRAIDFLITQPDASGAYNIVAPQCVMQEVFAKTLAHVLNRPALLRMPAFALKYLFGTQKARELLLEGQHVYPKRLLKAGFEFSYPDLESALNHVLRS